ncbi:MAG: hypothetical protein WDN31_08350 [Hyphomicrobium sp.]
MTAALWTWDNLVPAAIGVADGAPGGPITGFSLDTRSLQPGEVFVALRDVRDGHDFGARSVPQGCLGSPRLRRL